MHVINQPPKVSVIVPVYNTASYLTKCLDSLVHQTLQEIEIFVVNDGSTDASQEIIDDFAKRYPQKFQVHTQENQGQAVARNFALAHVKGQYIGFLDSDDFAKLEMFETMYRAAINHKADFISCARKDITYRGDEEVVLCEYDIRSIATCTKELFIDANASPTIHLYHRDVLVLPKIRFTEKRLYEDTSFYLNALPYVTKPYFVEKALVYRVRRVSSSSRVSLTSKVADIFPVMQASIDFYKERGFFPLYSQELEYFCARVLLCSSMQRISMVKSRVDRAVLVQQTFQFLQINFPQYKRNPYFKNNLKDLYVLSINKWTAKFYLEVFSFLEKRKRYI